MVDASTIRKQVRRVLRTAFADLPWWKRWLARSGVGLAAVGGVAQVLSLGSGGLSPGASCVFSTRC